MKSEFISLMILTCGLVMSGRPAFGAPLPDACRTGGFALGCQAWTFKEFAVLEAIQMTAAAGGKVIEFYPGQSFSADKPGLKWDHDATPEMIAAVRAQLEKSGVRAVNYGVVSVPQDEAGARRIFEFAKTLGLYGITTESVESLDTLEKLAKEYDLRVGIHNHPRRPLDPLYKNWDPRYVLGLIQGRDARLGSTADVGHWLRSGLDPVDCLKLLQGRVVSVHLKDLSEKSATAHDVPFGTGASNIAGILEELRRQSFAGNVSIEYEYHWTNSLPEVAQCVGFVRGSGAR